MGAEKMAMDKVLPTPYAEKIPTRIKKKEKKRKTLKMYLFLR